MNIIGREEKLCYACMEEHEVLIVMNEEMTVFKGIDVMYNTKSEYCSNTDEFTETESMINENDIAMKDAYRQAKGLLTSADLIAIREKYGVSQKDFSRILDWGLATIARYEKHQVQDRAHDDVLRRVADDPSWFLRKINASKGVLTDKAYLKYAQKARREISRKHSALHPIEWHVAVEVEDREVDFSVVNEIRKRYTKPPQSTSYTNKKSAVDGRTASMA